MQVPFDLGSFRKLKERADGAKQATYCIDVIFNPLIICMFMDDEFCNKMETFRPFVVNLVTKRVDDSIGVRLDAQKIKLVKSMRYKDGEGPDQNIPLNFAELPGDADCPDEQVPFKNVENIVSEPEPLIEDVTPGFRKPVIKKGFFNSKKAAPLYGENGSGEGVLPENAGDPMGWMPKKLRNTCKIVDCNNPEYQEKEKQKKQAEEMNASNKEFRDQLAKDMDVWTKTAEQDKWNEDFPDGTDPAKGSQKYDVDYSRFDNLDDVDDAHVKEERDWYFDGAEVKTRTEKPQVEQNASPNALTQSSSGVKKGFLSNAKAPLYPEGSEQKAPISEKYMMENLMAEYAAFEKKNAADVPQNAQTSIVAKTYEAKVPEFELKESPDGYLLSLSVPGLESLKDVNLDVTDTNASLSFPAGSGYKPLKVELSARVLTTSVKAKFSKKTKHINVTLPVADKSN